MVSVDHRVDSGGIKVSNADKADLDKHALNSRAEVDVSSKTRHKVEATWNWKHLGESNPYENISVSNERRPSKLLDFTRRC